MRKNSTQCKRIGERISANTPLSLTQRAIITFFVAIVILAPFLHELWIALRWILGTGYLASAAFRIWGVAVALKIGRSPDPPELGSAYTSISTWPRYTLVLALYREAHMALSLLRAIHALEYPKDRMEILVAVEKDDQETSEVCLQFESGIPLRTVCDERDTPKTKPRALNAALAVAAGEFLVVYDAEDQPHPLQLKEAALRFQSSDSAVAVLQAPLQICVDGRGSTVQKQFCLDYAGLFHVGLPALAFAGLAFPLGGSSNHFRVDALRCVGGWDPYNVTEDADIGFQFAKLGYRSELLQYPTYENAPKSLWPWIKQRSRWLKGHMATLKVHTRQWRDHDVGTIFSLFVTLGVNVLAAATTGPILLALSACFLLQVFGHPISLFEPFDIWVFVCGWGSAVLQMAVGAWRARIKVSFWILLIAPVFWALQCVALLRALHQYIYRPFHWDKTDHELPMDLALGSGLDAPPGLGLSRGGDVTSSPHLQCPPAARDEAMG